MAQTVMFIHGAFCGGWSFDAFRTAFERAGYQTHAPDLPFHGPHADLSRLAQTGIKEYAEDIARRAHHIGGPVILVGHSMGGLVAQVAAAKIDCAALVLLAPSAPWGVPATTLDEHANAFGVTLLGDYWRRAVPPDYPTARRMTLDRLTREESRRAFSRFVPESGRALFETLQWWLDHAMSTAAPPYRIAAPVLALTGARDHVNPTSTARRIVNRFPSGQARLLEMPLMSHWLMGEPEWPAVADAALEWLAAQGLGQRRRAGRAAVAPV
jgi:pimeloyl-ACP methyl ester carboxylesterase